MSAVAGIASGVGTIISIPGALAAADNPESGISKILNFLATGQSISDAKSVGGDLSDLLKGGQDIVTDFTKVYNELSQSNNSPILKQLSQQVATLTLQQMVANLRRQQANDTLAAAQSRVTDYATEVQNASTLLNSWNVDAVFLANAVNVMIGIARALTDIVAEDVFIARRAIEIYQLQDASRASLLLLWSIREQLGASFLDGKDADALAVPSTPTGEML